MRGPRQPSEFCPAVLRAWQAATGRTVSKVVRLNGTKPHERYRRHDDRRQLAVSGDAKHRVGRIAIVTPASYTNSAWRPLHERQRQHRRHCDGRCFIDDIIPHRGDHSEDVIAASGSGRARNSSSFFVTSSPPGCPCPAVASAYDFPTTPEAGYLFISVVECRASAMNGRCPWRSSSR